MFMKSYCTIIQPFQDCEIEMDCIVPQGLPKASPLGLLVFILFGISIYYFKTD